jgi:hypothetical protein
MDHALHFSSLYGLVLPAVNSHYNRHPGKRKYVAITVVVTVGGPCRQVNFVIDCDRETFMLAMFTTSDGDATSDGD